VCVKVAGQRGRERRCVTTEGNSRNLCGDEGVLYLDFDDCYTNLYMQQNYIELHTHTHT
jgi:hypothetical protein